MNGRDKKLKFFGFNRLAPYLRRYGGTYSLMIFSQLAVGVLGIIIPLFQKYAIDNFIAPSSLEGFAPFIAVYALFLAAFMVLGYLADFSACKIEMFVLRDLRMAGFNKLQTLSVSYFNRNSVGYIHSRLMSDASNISMAAAWDIESGVWSIAYIAGALIVMFTLNPLLALCVAAVTPVAAAVSAYFKKKLAVWQKRVRECNSQLTSDINEGVSGVATGKTLALEDRLGGEFSAHAAEMKRASVRHGHYRSLFAAVIAFLASVSLSVVLWYGGAITVDGVIFIGTLSVFMTYAQALCEQVQSLVEVFSDLVSVKVNTERFVGLMDEESEVEDSPAVVEKYGDRFSEKRENWEKLVGRIEFKDVTFRYPDGGENVLEHFDLVVPAGENVAIVGETGAGKSTIVNLVCRFFEPTEGEILIDGRPARERSVQWLHSNIGYVLQTPHLFSGTLRENLLYGNPAATEEEIFAALDCVHARGLAERLGGLDARVGEGGNTLSTGEKQLVSFARAILADPAVFILDEATSSIDALTECAVQDAVLKLMKGRTSFVIAHRLSTIRSADIILVVSDGKIVERGTHSELMRQRGEYYKLYIRQFKVEQTEKSL